LQKADSLRIISGEYSVKAARGAMYPSLTAFGSIGSNFASTYQQFAGIVPNGRVDTLGVIDIDGSKYYPTAPGYNTLFNNVPYFRQVGNINLNQSIGLQLNIPIFQGRQARTAYERAKINVEASRLQLAQDNQTLQQNIYTARANAEAAIQKYSANRKAAQYAQYAYDLSRKRYEIGMLSTSEYLIVQNNLETAKINEAAAFYDYIFRIKLLEFYKFGQVQL
jgi:outer membrane protein